MTKKKKTVDKQSGPSVKEKTRTYKTQPKSGTAHMSKHMTGYKLLCYTIQHRTVLTIFKIIITSHMLSIGIVE